MTETLEFEPPFDPAEFEFPDEAHATARIATAASGATIRIVDLMFRQDRLRIMIISPFAPADHGRRSSHVLVACARARLQEDTTICRRWFTANSRPVVRCCRGQNPPGREPTSAGITGDAALLGLADTFLVK